MIKNQKYKQAFINPKNALAVFSGSLFWIVLMFAPTVTFAQQANLDLVTKFAPWLGFDQGASGNGYPMSAQAFRDKIDIVNTVGGKTDGKWDSSKNGGFIQPGIGLNELYIQNLAKGTLTNGTAPTYFQYREVGPKKQVRIQYWWFYGFQVACSVGGSGSHHGDWESDGYAQ
jgi:hypothetical protein